MPYLGIFGLEFKSNIVIFEISTLKFVKNDFLTHTVSSYNEEGPESAFSQGPGPLCKVCRFK